MKINTLFPSKYLKADDLQEREWTLPMASVKLEEMGNPPAPGIVSARWPTALK